MRPEPKPHLTQRERGWALISVLWTLSILTILVATAQSLSFGSAQRERRALDDAQIGAALDAGIVRAVLGIGDSRPDKRWRVDGVAQDFVFEGQTVRVTVQDEFGRIDLNAADGSLLRQVLVSAGLAQDRADVVNDNILAWRSPPSAFVRLHGQSDGDYAAAGLAYRPRHGAFQSVDELRLVLGMTPELFARIAPALTIYSRHPAIDTNTAPRAALLAYYPNQPERVGDILKARNAAGLQSGLGGRVGVLADVSNLAGRTFAVIVEFPQQRRAHKRQAVFMLTNDPNHPFLIMAWR